MGSNGVADSSPLPVSERINDTGQSAGKPAVPMHESEGDRRGNPATSGKRRRLRAVQPIQFASPGLDTFAGSRKEFRRPPLSAKDTVTQILPTLALDTMPATRIDANGARYHTAGFEAKRWREPNVVCQHCWR